MKIFRKNQIKRVLKLFSIVGSVILSAILIGVACYPAPPIPPVRPTPEPQDWGYQFATFRIQMAVNPATEQPFYNYLSRYDWRNATFTMEASNGDYSFNDVGGRLRGRGNSTWNVSATTVPTTAQRTLIDAGQINPNFRNHWDSSRNPASARMQKWPFRIRFDEPRSMLGSTSTSTDWSFIANHSDYTQLRNESAKMLSRSLTGMDWQTRSRFVHVYWNGEYRGLYWMAEQLEVSNYYNTRQQDRVTGRVPLRYDPDPAYSEYFIELDLRADRLNTNVLAHHETDFRLSPEFQQAPREGVDYLRVGGRLYDIRFPDDTREAGIGRSGQSFERRWNTPEHVNYLRRFITEVDNAIISRNWNRINQWIDINSFIDYYLVHEFFKNMDSGGLSVHKTIRGIGSERRMHLGPIWDFDLSAGNTDPSPSWGSINQWNARGGYSHRGIWPGYINRWFRHLLGVPQFFRLAGERFAEIRDNQIQDMMDGILEFATENVMHFERNFIRWPNMLGQRTWAQSPEIVALGSGEGAWMRNVEHLINWFDLRRDWMSDWFEFGSGMDTLPLTFNR